MRTTTDHDQTSRELAVDGTAAPDRDETRADRRFVAPVEDRRDRVTLVREAGWRRISWGSVIAGVFVAYGAFAILLGVVTAILDAIGVDTNGLSSTDWRTVGAGSAAALFLVLLVTYFYGGYVAGRMARRSGFLQGVLVFVMGVAVLAAVAGVVITLDGTDAIRDRLHDLGAPTSGSQWTDIGSAAGIAGLVAMFVGAVLGGIRGERWHQRLVDRANDPAYGPSAVPADRTDADRTDADRDDDRGDDARSDDTRERPADTTVHDGAAADGDPERRVASSQAPGAPASSTTVIDRPEDPSRPAH